MPGRLFLPVGQSLALGAAGASAIWLTPVALAPVVVLLVVLSVVTYAAIFGEEV